MKKIILAVFVVLVSFSGNAQEKSAFEKDTYTLVEKVTKGAMTSLISQFIGMVPSEKQAGFIKEFHKLLPDLYTAVSKIYMKEFSHKDIKGMIKFYESALGKKLLSKQGSLMKKSIMAGQSLGMKLQTIIQRYQ